ncbi:MAG: type II toxin-antitoxin system prevent-host-death family antitoxin [Gemmataceae bacterium]
MQTVIVSIAEAQAQLPDLIARVAAGDQVVISQDGESVANLGKPSQFPTTSNEVTGAKRRADLIRAVIAGHEEQGEPLPTDHPLRAALEREQQG